MEAGEPIRAFTLTTVEAEILDRSRRLKPKDREQLVNVLRQMTGDPATAPGHGPVENHPDHQRGAAR